MPKRRRTKTWKLMNVMARDTRHALKDFRARTVIHGRRLSVLREYAALWLVCASLPGSYEFAREAAQRSRKRWHAGHSGAICFTGCGRKAEHAHHVIQLQHGGADISDNKVPLCGICHADVHPWMPAETTVDAAERPMWSR